MPEDARSALLNFFLPNLLRKEVQRLIDTLTLDLPYLCQGETIQVEDGQINAGCLVSTVLIWRGAKTPTDLDMGFSEFVARAGEGILPLLRWFDETKRSEMRRELLSELIDYLTE